MLYAEAEARPALGAAARRALAAAERHGGTVGSGPGGGGGGGGAGGWWGSMTATNGSEDAASAAAAAAVAGAAAAAAGTDLPFEDGGSASQRRRRRRLLGDTRWRVGDASAYPYSAVAYMVYTQPLTAARFQCTATFVTPWDVLTAAHCVWDFDNGTGYRDWRIWPALASNQAANAAAIRSDYVTFYRTENGSGSGVYDLYGGGSSTASNGSTARTDASYGHQRYDVNYYDIALIRVKRPHTSWLGIKYDCGRTSYDKTLACGYPATYPATYWQACSQCYLPTSRCRPMWQMYDYCYSTRGQSGMAITDLEDLRVLGVLSGGPTNGWDWSFWTPIDAFHFSNLVRWMWPAGGTDGALRLSDGPNDWSGRLELCLGGLWGSVCDTDWGWDDARVACRQLGFPGGGEAITGGWFPSAAAGVPVHLTTVACVGNEDALAACAARALSAAASAAAAVAVAGGCGHVYDAGVICVNSEVASPPPASGRTNGSGWQRGAYPCGGGGGGGEEEGALRLVAPPAAAAAAGATVAVSSRDGGAGGESEQAGRLE
ncbi:Neurotrypsin, partial [Tetrabaena socialis]